MNDNIELELVTLYVNKYVNIKSVELEVRHLPNNNKIRTTFPLPQLINSYYIIII